MSSVIAVPVVLLTWTDRLTTPKEWSGVNIDDFPALKKWLFKLLERPGFEKGRHVPEEHKAFDLAKLTEEEMEEKAAGGRAWVQASMKEEAKQ